MKISLRSLIKFRAHSVYYSVQILWVLGLIIIPIITQAKGILPCEGLECGWCHLMQLGDNIIDWLMMIAIPVVTLFLIIGGFRLMFAGGSSDNYTKGVDMIRNALIGLVILMVSWALINLVIQLLGGSNTINGLPWYTLQCTG